MRFIHYVSIRHKLRLIVLAACGITFLVIAGALLSVDFYFFRTDYQRGLSGIGRLACDQLALSGLKSDLKTLFRDQSEVDGGAVFLKNGKIGDQFGLPTEKTALAGHPPTPTATHLQFVAPIGSGEHPLGTLYLVSTYPIEAQRRQGIYAWILGGSFISGWLIAGMICSRLERMIADPIRHLTWIARAIGSRNDYSLRANNTTAAELGELTESFNQMLTRIQERDAALRHQIAERLRAEQALERAQNELIEASRQEGMAEVATGILHNVGNVLNSVNTSATLIAEKLHDPRMDLLGQAGELIHSHAGDLPNYLTKDPKGILLPNYLHELSLHLAAQRNLIIDELMHLLKNIEHIKEIVAMQQRHACSHGMIEALDLADLVEDALRLHASAFELDDIVVTRDFASLPLITVEKHRVLQILVNLIRNAQQALDAAPLKVKSLIVKIFRQDQNVAICVTDNGIGIEEKNLTRIFAHGFTTRRDGHGFGLNSGAIAAQQMGGHLTVHSDGPGQGATFTLSLPIVSPPKNEFYPDLPDSDR